MWTAVFVGLTQLLFMWSLVGVAPYMQNHVVQVFVRKDTLQKLMEVYRTYCTKCFEGSIAMDKEFEWIPSKIVRCCYDKDCKDFK